MHYQIEITEVSSFELGRIPDSKVITSKANHSRLLKEGRTITKNVERLVKKNKKEIFIGLSFMKTRDFKWKAKLKIWITIDRPLEYHHLVNDLLGFSIKLYILTNTSLQKEPQSERRFLCEETHPWTYKSALRRTFESVSCKPRGKPR